MEKEIKNFINEWKESYPSTVKKIISIIKKKDKEQLKQFFEQEERYCFTNCGESCIDEYWSDLKWLKQDAMNILNTID